MKINHFLLCMALFQPASAQDSWKFTVLFDLDQHHLTSDEEEKLLNWLQAQPDSVMKVEIVGYADHLGSEEYNLHLSELRAQHVLFLIEQWDALNYRLSLTVAEGEKFATVARNGNPNDRKVEVAVTRLSSPKREQSVLEVGLADDLPKTAIDRLAQMQEGESLVLENLNFFPGQHFLVPMALPELEKLIRILKDRPSLEIEIQGHICCILHSIDGLDVNTGTYSLSENRAKYIFDQLILAGIDAKRLRYKGFAGRMPLVFPEITEGDKAKNRRVELRILKN